MGEVVLIVAKSPMFLDINDECDLIMLVAWAGLVKFSFLIIWTLKHDRRKKKQSKENPMSNIHMNTEGTILNKILAYTIHTERVTRYPGT